VNNLKIKTRLLIIDDEEKIRKIVKICLKNKNFQIIEAQNGAMGIRMFLSCKPDLVLTDLSLPDMDGKEVIKMICELGNVPIIAFSVHDDDHEIIDTLNAGAYDYVIKPFNPEVLLARINTNLRRSVVNQQNTVGEFLINGKIKIDLLKHEVIIDDKPVFFPLKQYNLLKFLMINKGKVLTHKEILKEVWGDAYVQESQYLRVHIGNIRSKINFDVIHTTPGVGYSIENIG
jgi:two-component system KDP operon response regulator KdpE